MLNMNFILMMIILAVAAILLYTILRKQKTKPAPATPVPEVYKKILQQEVPFYQQLNASRQKSFENRLQQFLNGVKITGVKTVVEDIDRVLVAASAIIPIFNFDGWRYVNLHEVLLYPDSFNHDFEQQGAGRDILGMVGSGAMNNIMILSQFELRQAFSNKTGKNNTAIHEFVHLVDKTDGSIDGVPAFILDKQYILPWLQRMREEIDLIKKDQSDIDAYGASNESEFFAVVSEYFFERPELLKEKHPELYELLLKIFNPKTGL
jgi:MtfA peptidase